ncbi:MAG TPA: tetratricopeptide repeat protein [Candidatus Acidoferrum sp.]|nr:tetratricopeptide repeat protein [Candidatus Acidoferrum sp.]
MLYVFLPILFAKARTDFQSSPTIARPNVQSNEAQGDTELQSGVALTRQGRFREAIPHLLMAQGRVSNEFAADFNLALCYVATGQNQAAIPVLQSVLSTGHATAGVFNLLAQALVGVSRQEEAFEVFQRSVSLDPKNEKLYLFLADSCMDHQSYGLGLKVIATGLQHLPKSARMHYERGILLSFLDQPDEARLDLKSASELAPGTTIAFLAEAQSGLLDGTMLTAIRAARNGLRKEPENYVLLTILGQALIREGVSPGQPEFDEAQTALEKSAAARPDYSVSQLALGQLYLIGNRLKEAITHLEEARRLAPDNPSVYSQLAAAYRRRGDLDEAEKMLTVLTGLNREQAAKYKLDPPDHKGSYMGTRKQ